MVVNNYSKNSLTEDSAPDKLSVSPSVVHGAVIDAVSFVCK